MQAEKQEGVNVPGKWHTETPEPPQPQPVHFVLQVLDNDDLKLSDFLPGSMEPETYCSIVFTTRLPGELCEARKPEAVDWLLGTLREAVKKLEGLTGERGDDAKD